ncbi:hypothetical protein EGM70_20475 [Enterobacteriaceae bacterium 89]|nr:hypothetical protein [Enterobacteriaceae bacterium 89]
MKISVKLEDQNDSSLKKSLLEEQIFTHFFSSRLHEMAFYFKVNNANFDKYLGIKPLHKTDPLKAAKLKKIYLKIFHPDASLNKKDSDKLKTLDLDEICQDIESYFYRVSGGKVK